MSSKGISQGLNTRMVRGHGILAFLSVVIFVTPCATRAADSLKEIAIKFNDATSAYLIAEKHYKGHGAEQSYEQALQWYTKAAELGHVRSELKLGKMYYYGKGAQKNLSSAAKWLLQPAEQGYSDAQYLLGLIYLNGDNSSIAKNASDALYWFKKAADDYHADAAYHVGRMYYYGLGEQVNLAQAQSYLKLAKESGNLQARQLLANIESEQQKLVETQEPQFATAEAPQIALSSPLSELLKLAQAGDVAAQFELAQLYFNGTPNKRPDSNDAFYWYEQAARNGHSESQFKLGWFYYNGEFIAKDLTLAQYWFDEAAKQNHSGAKQQVALMKAQTKKQKQSQSDILIAQANQGNKDAQYQLGLLYLNGEKSNRKTAISQNTPEALRWFIAAANQNHVEAQFQVGMIYFDPQSTENTQAEQWLTKAASNQHLEAQYFLGSLYESQGEADKAAKWLDRAVEQNHDGALDLLFLLYLDKRLSSVDKNKAIQWLEKASQKGYIEAQYQLGEHYLQENLQGNADEKSVAKAYEWIYKAAAKGHTQAQYRLGLMYKEGKGVNKHYTKSAGWLRRAAEGGQVDAQFQLGEMYRLGLGLPKKQILAKKWYQQAADQGHMEAKLRLSSRSRY
ncbi:tetratricopeptide repeat protein [Kaarinaea lacus]